MAASLGSIGETSVRLTADMTGLRADFGRARSESHGAGLSAGNAFREGWSRVKDVAGGILAAAGIRGALDMAVDAVRDGFKSIAAEGAAFRRAGAIYGALGGDTARDQIKTMAREFKTELGETGRVFTQFGSELKSFGFSGTWGQRTSEELTRLTYDIAAFAGEMDNVEGVGNVIMRAAGGMTRGLSAMGLHLDEIALKSLSLKLTGHRMEELDDRTQAYVRTQAMLQQFGWLKGTWGSEIEGSLGGQLRQFKQAWNDLFQGVAKYAIPKLKAILPWVRGIMTELTDAIASGDWSKIWKRLKEGFKWFSSVIADGIKGLSGMISEGIQKGIQGAIAWFTTTDLYKRLIGGSGQNLAKSWEETKGFAKPPAQNWVPGIPDNNTEPGPPGATMPGPLGAVQRGVGAAASGAMFEGRNGNQFGLWDVAKASWKMMPDLSSRPFRALYKGIKSLAGSGIELFNARAMLPPKQENADDQKILDKLDSERDISRHRMEVWNRSHENRMKQIASEQGVADYRLEKARHENWRRSPEGIAWRERNQRLMDAMDRLPEPRVASASVSASGGLSPDFPAASVGAAAPSVGVPDPWAVARLQRSPHSYAWVHGGGDVRNAITQMDRDRIRTQILESGDPNHAIPGFMAKSRGAFPVGLRDPEKIAKASKPVQVEMISGASNIWAHFQQRGQGSDVMTGYLKAISDNTRGPIKIKAETN